LGIVGRQFDDGRGSNVSPTDIALAERWRKHRDADAFREIVSRHGAMVYGACKRILKDPTEAEDAAQDCFLRLIQSPPSVRSSLAGWLYDLATHQSLNHVRSEIRRRQREAASQPEAYCSSPAPYDDIQEYVDEAVATLPARLRHPIVAHYLEGRSHEVIAGELRLSQSSVTRRIQKGIAQVRTALDRRGIAVSSEGLSACFAVCRAETVSATLMSTLDKMVLSAGVGAAVNVMARGGIIAMSKLTWAAIAVTVLAMIGAGYVFLHNRDRETWDLGAKAAYEQADHERNDERATAAPNNAATGQSDGADLEPSKIGGNPTPADDSAPGESMDGESEPSVQEKQIKPPDYSGRHLGYIGGWVTDNHGAAMVGVQVHAGGVSGGGAASSTRDGRFTIDIRQPVSPSTALDSDALYTVEAEQSGYIPATELRVPLDEKGLHLVLTQHGRLHGMVVDAVTQAPIAEFDARIARERTPLEGPQPTGNPWSSFTDGAFDLPTHYDVTEVEARAEGYAKKIVSVSVPQGEEYEGLVIALEPGNDIRGIVLDAATREPIEGAHVGIAVGQIPEYSLSEGDRYEAVTGSDGRFLIAGKAAGEHVDLKIWHSSYAPEFIINHEVAHQDEIKVFLSKGGAIKGKVVRSGVPVTGLRVHVRQAFGRAHVVGVTSPEVPSYLTWTGTDNDGVYEFTNLPYGRYLLRILDPSANVPLRSRYLVRTWVDVEDGRTADLLHELLDYGQVRGTIAGLDSFQGVAVSISDARYPAEPIYMTGEKHDSIGPDESGQFQFGPVSAGEYVVRAIAPGEPPRQVEQLCTVGAGDALVLQLAFE
jgi:RNA polymerase sigma factor (sigma-70 family)